LQARTAAEHTAPQGEAYKATLDRREDNEPVAYITGVKEFYGRPFKCDARALIPRPETEALIERALAVQKAAFDAQAKPCPRKILELGTGVGNIATTLAAEGAVRGLPMEIVSTDLEPSCVELAKENYAALVPRTEIVRTTFVVADLFEHETIRAHAPYDLVIANLPYVPSTWAQDPKAQRDVVFFEPDIALFGGEDGLDIYREFAKQLSSFLKEDGQLLIEHNEDQTPLITALIQYALPEHTLITHVDYAGLDRALEALPK